MTLGKLNCCAPENAAIVNGVGPTIVNEGQLIEEILKREINGKRKYGLASKRQLFIPKRCQFI